MQHHLNTTKRARHSPRALGIMRFNAVCALPRPSLPPTPCHCSFMPLAAASHTATSPLPHHRCRTIQQTPAFRLSCALSPQPPTIRHNALTSHRLLLYFPGCCHICRRQLLVLCIPRFLSPPLGDAVNNRRVTQRLPASVAIALFACYTAYSVARENSSVCLLLSA